MPRRKPQKLSFKPVVVRPCEESWGEMTGTLRERHCPLCDKKVHNFAAMTVAEIERLTLESGGHMCARITQRKDPRFSFDAGIGQVAGTIGTTEVPTPEGPIFVPVNLDARKVFGIGASYKF